MKLRTISFFWIIALFLFLPNLSAAHLLKDEEVYSKVYLTKEQALKKAFPDGEEVVKTKIWMDKEQGKFISDLTGEAFNKVRQKAYFGKKGENTTALAIFDQINNPGHHPMSFEYMVVFQPEGKIKKVIVLDYRGLQRDEIVSEKFLSQFIGKDANSDFQKVNSTQGVSVPVQVISDGILKLTAIVHTHVSNSEK